MKKCAICGKPLDSGMVVHPECVPRWIPVTERLPDDGQRVLAYDKVEYGIIAAIYSAGTWYDQILDTTVCPIYITHWMPLPEPPEEAE